MKMLELIDMQLANFTEKQTNFTESQLVSMFLTPHYEHEDHDDSEINMEEMFFT